MLTAVGRILKGDLRGSTDFAGKYAQGDEFGLIVRASLSDGKDRIAERLRKLIASSDFEINVPGSKQLARGITVSAGVTALREGESHAAFEERADKALLRAKRTGKNRTVSIP